MDFQRGPPQQHVDVCVPSCLFCAFMLAHFWRSWMRSERHVAIKNRTATRSNEWIARPFLVSPNTKIENRLEMALSKAKSGARGSVEPCDLLETRSSLHYASRALFKQQASTQLSGSPLRGPESLNECFHLSPRHPPGHCCVLELWHLDLNAKQIACLSKLWTCENRDHTGESKSMEWTDCCETNSEHQAATHHYLESALPLNCATAKMEGALSKWKEDRHPLIPVQGEPDQCLRCTPPRYLRWTTPQGLETWRKAIAALLLHGKSGKQKAWN